MPMTGDRRSPQGERGLKSLGPPTPKPSQSSLSARRAWIEIQETGRCAIWCPTSLSARRAWIEIHARDVRTLREQSLSARRAWIEIVTAAVVLALVAVSLSARRAWIEIMLFCAENQGARSRSPQGERGLKSQLVPPPVNRIRSLSARRAWIEIASDAESAAAEAEVALRKESVD